MNEVAWKSVSEQIDSRGWCVVDGPFCDALLDAVADEMGSASDRRHEIRRRNGVEGSNDGTLHHLVGDHPSFLEILAGFSRFDALLHWYFSGMYILNSYGGVINRRDKTAYVHSVHRDIRFSSDTKRFMLNALVMVDAFTIDNGATWLLSGSQHLRDRPPDQCFFKKAERAVGRKGAVLFFDSRIWHATGQNITDRPRRALTLTFTSPFFKQQLDYPRLLGYENVRLLDPFLKQVIGFNERVPATLDEYYVPLAHRFYQRGQDD